MNSDYENISKRKTNKFRNERIDSYLNDNYRPTNATMLLSQGLPRPQIAFRLDSFLVWETAKLSNLARLAEDSGC